MSEKRPYSRSKKFAWALTVCTVILTFYAINRGCESAASVIFPAGVGSAAALYGNKQFQERKIRETERYGGKGEP